MTDLWSSDPILFQYFRPAIASDRRSKASYPSTSTTFVSDVSATSSGILGRSASAEKLSTHFDNFDFWRFYNCVPYFRRLAAADRHNEAIRPLRLLWFLPLCPIFSAIRRRREATRPLRQLRFLTFLRIRPVFPAMSPPPIATHLSYPSAATTLWFLTFLQPCPVYPALRRRRPIVRRSPAVAARGRRGVRVERASTPPPSPLAPSP